MKKESIEEVQGFYCQLLDAKKLADNSKKNFESLKKQFNLKHPMVTFITCKSGVIDKKHYDEVVIPERIDIVPDMEKIKSKFKELNLNFDRYYTREEKTPETTKKEYYKVYCKPN